ncbi:glutamine amidotransferase-related protein [Agarivorans sp. QJM3NY_33]|uniref:glutamine amidotransferase-related protein n=1 Tax=Agarivorans sp. QJM3NY_33 TaxID=3421432 RepID=UPI003D7EDD46
MHIAIINCDKVDSNLAKHYGEYSDMFIAHLGAQDASLTFEVFNALEQQLPSLTDFDGYLITGSRHNAYDQDLWINALIRWVQECEQVQAPLAGICFGHQLIARALGGEVAKSDKGWGLGVANNQLIKAPSWAEQQTAPERLHILVSHQDQVLQLPEHAERLASSDFCPNFMFQIGQHILAIQGHPEFEYGYAEALIDKRQQLLSPEAFSCAKQSLQQALDADLVFNWILQMYRHAKC